MSDKKFANLDRKSLDRLNDMQHEITDAEGKGVILVAFDRDCGGCKGGCGGGRGLLPIRVVKQSKAFISTAPPY